jgi:hypothetical protein
MSGTMDEPLGRKSTVRPCATRAATESNAPIGVSISDGLSAGHLISGLGAGLRIGMPQMATPGIAALPACRHP